MLGSQHDNSNFDFEGLMGTIKQAVHGTQYMCSQIASNFLLQHFLPTLVSNLSPAAQELYRELTDSKRISKWRSQIYENVYSLGKLHVSCSIDIAGVRLQNVFESACKCYTFDRILVGSDIVTSEAYKRQSKRINFCVEYTCDDERYLGLVKLFLADENKTRYVAIMDRLLLAEDIPTPVEITEGQSVHFKVQRPCGLYDIVPIKEIGQKCMYLDIESLQYCIVCKMPNSVEY